jgi:hypothetical protein
MGFESIPAVKYINNYLYNTPPRITQWMFAVLYLSLMNSPYNSGEKLCNFLPLVFDRSDDNDDIVMHLVTL